MHRFLHELSDGLRRCQIGNERALVAVSGGADSVALLRGMIELSAEFSLELCVAHLNHGLRGPDSDADAEWVRSLAKDQGLPCEIGRVANETGEFAHNEIVKNRMSQNVGGGIEEWARNARYQFFDRAATQWGCRSIVLAHTADDQAETVLHRFLRGTGLSGLRGMLTVRNSAGGHLLSRPLLSIRRTLLEEYLRELGQSFRTDVTNQDVTMTRNRLRHIILPLLREQVNPQVDAALCRLAEQAVEVEAFVKQHVEQLLERSLKDSQVDACRLDIHVMADQSPYIVRELFREIWQRQRWPLQAMGAEHWNRLAGTIHSRQTITLPNRIEARYHSETLLVLRRLSPAE